MHRCTRASSPTFPQRVLGQLFEWSGQLSHVPPLLATARSLVSVGTSELLGSLRPRLASLTEQLKSAGVGHAQALCRKILEQTAKHIEVVCTCVRACDVCVCVCACVRACVRACV